MSIKKIRTKLETVEIIDSGIPRIVFERDGKYFADISSCEEIDKSVVLENNITIIKFTKPSNL